jgi:hypothetical protein
MRGGRHGGGEQEHSHTLMQLHNVYLRAKRHGNHSDIALAWAVHGPDFRKDVASARFCQRLTPGPRGQDPTNQRGPPRAAGKELVTSCCCVKVGVSHVDHNKEWPRTQVTRECSQTYS